MTVLYRNESIKVFFWVVIFATFLSVKAATSNLTCYQCERHDEEECDAKALRPCSSTFDRCAIHFSKNAQEGLVIKRQCGLAPCSFDDEMTSRGLGMTCDRSKDTYSCTFCCKENGCNKNGANVRALSLLLLFFGQLLICILNVARDFAPPFFMAENGNFKK